MKVKIEVIEKVTGKSSSSYLFSYMRIPGTYVGGDTPTLPQMENPNL